MALHGDDWIGSCKLVIEFHAGPFSSPAFAGDVHLVSYLEVWFSIAFVGLLHLSFLSSSKVLSSPLYGFMSPGGEGLCLLPSEGLSWSSSLPCAFLPVEVKSWLVTKFKFIGGIASGGVREDGLSEINAREEVRPVVLEVVDEGTEVLINVLVENLCVAISLW